MIHPTAIVDPQADLHSSVSVGPYSIIGPGVVIGEDTIVESHVVIKGPTTIGARNHIFQFSSIGESLLTGRHTGSWLKPLFAHLLRHAHQTSRYRASH